MSNPPNDGSTPPAATTPPGDGSTPPAASAYASIQPPADGSTPPAPPAPLHERIPEKYRVAKADGTIDLEASTAKLLDGHTELEKTFGARKTAPKTPDEYAPKVEGFDFEELKNDEQYKGFLKSAHARGFSNDDVSWILGEYAQRAGGDAGVMSVDEFKAAMLSGEWKDEATYNQNMQLGLKAIRAYHPDITAEELNGLPNHPLVAKILAAVGKEVGEDRVVQVQPLSAADFDTQLAALQASEAYNNASHAEHAQAIAKVEELFNKRYPPGKSPR
jgi:hypothetical protein